MGFLERNKQCEITCKTQKQGNGFAGNEVLEETRTKFLEMDSQEYLVQIEGKKEGNTSSKMRMQQQKVSIVTASDKAI